MKQTVLTHEELIVALREKIKVVTPQMTSTERQEIILGALTDLKDYLQNRTAKGLARLMEEAHSRAKISAKTVSRYAQAVGIEITDSPEARHNHKRNSADSVIALRKAQILAGVKNELSAERLFGSIYNGKGSSHWRHEFNKLLCELIEETKDPLLLKNLHLLTEERLETGTSRDFKLGRMKSSTKASRVVRDD